MTKILVQLNPDVQPTGSDLAVVNAARRSFGRRSELNEDGTLKTKDKRLIEFLARGMTADDFQTFLTQMSPLDNNNFPEMGDKLWEWRNTPTHDTPFNHGFISFEVKAPIFVRAQLVKHEYLILSEFSRRYITDDVEFYEPGVWRGAAKDKKQGSSDKPATLTHTSAKAAREYKHDAFEYYEDLLLDGVAPEQARMLLPQSLMTSWTWSGTLGAFAKMCTLRLHPEAQYESRLVAQEVYKHLKDVWPVSAPALVEGVK